MQSIRPFQIIGLLVLVSALAGCNANPGTPTLNPTEGVELLAGVYTTTISEADAAQYDSLDPNLPYTQGEYRITFLADGNFQAEANGQWLGDGSYTAIGSELEIYLKSVCDDCPCVQSIGRYKWELQEEKLYMEKQAGVCDPMHVVLTTHPLVRQP